MNGTPYRETARIYQFPVRARTAPGVAREGAKSVIELRLPRIAVAAFDSWYHEAAVETERTHKR